MASGNTLIVFTARDAVPSATSGATHGILAGGATPAEGVPYLAFDSASDEYADFLRLVLEHADLQLRSKPRTEALSAEQEERRLLLFDLLIALFERAYLLVYEDDMSRKQARLWQSWEDYMHFWCQREDFRALLVEMLDGEDPDFSRHLLRIAEAEALR